MTLRTLSKSDWKYMLFHFPDEKRLSVLSTKVVAKKIEPHTTLQIGCSVEVDFEGKTVSATVMSLHGK